MEKQSTSSISESIEPLNKYVCERIRQLRKRRSWTLEQLATQSGVSRSMLSQVERGVANPTLAVAFRITRAFGITIGDLVDGASSQKRIDLIRADDKSTIFRDDKECRIRTLSPLNLEKDVEFYELTLHPNGRLDSAAHYEGTREFLTVRQGRVSVTAGNESFEVGDGDSAQFPADVEHCISNLCDSISVLFLVDIYVNPV